MEERLKDWLKALVKGSLVSNKELVYDNVKKFLGFALIDIKDDKVSITLENTYEYTFIWEVRPGNYPGSTLFFLFDIK